MQKVKDYLFDQHKLGKVNYGTFESDMSLMTCLIQSGRG